MKVCPNCKSQISDEVVFCPVCGTNVGGIAPQGAPFVAQGAPYQQAPVYQYKQPDPADHTAEFDAADISENKTIAMLPYLLGTLGIIIALIAMNQSKYISFHVRQALKLIVVNTLLGLAAAILVWTFIVPIAAGICMFIVFVLKIIAFFQVCSGKAQEPAIIKNLGFLK